MASVTISPKDVSELRARTGAGMMDCKRALEEAGGDMDKAAEILRKKGIAKAEKRAGRVAAQGLVVSYIHHNQQVGVLLELNCETDFVARTEDFQQLARDIAMQIAGMAPQWVSREDVPADVVEEQKRLFAVDAERDGRPAERVPMIVEGKLNKWYEAVCLLEQPFRDSDRKISDLITDKVALLGENIRVARFARMAVGESAADADGDSAA
jgi:elongation factor Ts